MKTQFAAVGLAFLLTACSHRDEPVGAPVASNVAAHVSFVATGGVLRSSLILTGAPGAFGSDRKMINEGSRRQHQVVQVRTNGRLYRGHLAAVSGHGSSALVFIDDDSDKGQVRDTFNQDAIVDIYGIEESL